MFLSKNVLGLGDILTPLLYNFSFGYAIRRIQINQGGLILNNTDQLSVYINVVNMKRKYNKAKGKRCVSD
jgi:hypothetical protein